jgi:hypothetical protein
MSERGPLRVCGGLSMFRARWAILPLLATMSPLGCRSNVADTDQTVPECREYESQWARCTGNRAAIATQPEMLAKSEADRLRLKTLCSSNLERLKQACR